MTELERKLYEKYFNDKILDVDHLDDDPDKIFKLIVMYDLFNPQISEDLALLHHIERMYGESTLCRILQDNDCISLLISDIYPETFGYSINKHQFQYVTTYLDSDDEVHDIIICTNPEYSVTSLNNLRCWKKDFSNYNFIYNVPQKASLTLEFVKHYSAWSEEFHWRLNEMLR